jgi:hypothetical protein
VNISKIVGTLTAIAATVIGEWALALSICRGIGGSILGFGLLCEAPACPAQSIFTIQTPGSTFTTGILMLIFVGLPFGLLAYSTVERWSRPLPPK